MNRPDLGGATTRGTLTVGRIGPRSPGPPTGRGPIPPARGPVLGPPSRPVSSSWPAVTSAPPALYLDTHARPAPTGSSPAVEPAPTPAAPRHGQVLVTALGALAGLLLTCVSVLLPWHAGTAGGAGIVGTAFGIGVLVVCAGLLATVVVDLLERRVRWLALVAATPLALVCIVLVATIAAAVSGTSVAVHLALAGLPWPGPVVSGAGVWLFATGQAICLVVGALAVTGWVRGVGDDEPPAAPSARRSLTVASCALAAALVVVVSGIVLAGTGAPIPHATVAPSAPVAGGSS